MSKYLKYLKGQHLFLFHNIYSNVSYRFYLVMIIDYLLIIRLSANIPIEGRIKERMFRVNSGFLSSTKVIESRMISKNVYYN